MSGQHTVLVVDDETSIISYVQLGLQHVGYNVVTATTGAAALECVKSARPHLVILDIMLPDIDGLTVCRTLRTFSEVPVLLLTARDEADDVVRGLESGADGYLPKPFKLQELLARVHALLRLVGTQPSDEIHWNDLCLDRAAQQLIRDGQRIDLTAREFTLLQILMERPRRIHTREELMAAVWGEGERDLKTLKACISLLRVRFGEERRHAIRSVRGVGYTLDG